MIVVACITFAHSTEDVMKALLPAIELKHRHGLTVVRLDDSSGRAPRTGSEVQDMNTPGRQGYAGAVNHLVKQFPLLDRLVLINPDASLTSDALQLLVTSSAELSAPRVLGRSGDVENVRRLLTPGRLLFGLLLGERVAGKLDRGVPLQSSYSCPPFAPSGSVVSVKGDLLRRWPLTPEMFWLEQSDWLRRVGRAVTLEIVDGEAQHTGASTSAAYPLSVAGSQLRARWCYVRRYAPAFWLPALFGATGLRCVRFAVSRGSLRDGLFLFQAALGRVSWKVSR